MVGATVRESAASHTEKQAERKHESDQLSHLYSSFRATIPIQRLNVRTLYRIYLLLSNAFISYHFLRALSSSVTNGRWRFPRSTNNRLIASGGFLRC